ncbi:spore-associated protein A [Nonomuraea sp. SMC257]|uniref:Spore-associated protein A n=1 Tax=Nonomuraea montanisoli TaxID=2741721 RepID=A0A7Y6IGW2_9ACTN|nr:spore-associated protein A [Nonomuraea montanisoli]NUW37433.1 spore-associated protein A [Nonomuraea montanisoli]
MRTRSGVATLAGVALASTCFLASPTPASAAGPCGSGYNRIGVYAIPQSGPKVGSLEVYYNAGNGKNCALAYGIGPDYYGKSTYKDVAIRRAGGSGGWVSNQGYFTYYAGPVYLSAQGTCIDLAGYMGGTERYVWNVHCG